MRLELGSFPVEEVAFGPATRLDGRRLEIDPRALAEAVAAPPFARVDVDLVRRGESARITQISDVVEPRIKVSGLGEIFPGLLGPVGAVGEGRTHRLAGVAVVVQGEVPWLGQSGLFVPRDNFVDTAGPGAEFTPLSSTHNVVVRITFAESGFDHEAYQQAVLLAGLKAARFLAETTRDLDPAEITVRDLGAEPTEQNPSPATLPKVLYAYQVQSQGVFMRTYLYGRPQDDLVPTLVHPNEISDGALVAGGLGGAAVKITTWLHQNNPLIEGLFARHGRAWRFGGVILHRGHYYQYEDKQRVAIRLAAVARMAGADAVIFSLGGGGNNITEVMLAIQACEQAGIKTVLMTWEHGGKQGTDYPLPFAVPQAACIVSTGSMDEPVQLPAMERMVGNTTIRIRPEVGGESMDVSGALSLRNRYELFGDSNPVGWQRTGAREL
ncbi:MAG TPA: glycine/sarcosine/betaine reductase component B subunit [Chloroflexia bacterium]|nr:glycine/sarcosine/betaine reductase component B subunit [Chloroflexia bacterium]